MGEARHLWTPGCSSTTVLGLIPVQHATSSDQPQEWSPVGDERQRRPGRLHLRLRVLELAFSAVPPFVAGRVRTMAMRAAGLSIGKSSIFFGLPTLVGPEPISERFRVGTDCGFNAGCFFDLEDSITIGDHVAAGHDVMFLTSCPKGRAGGREARKTAPVVIGSGVWLGARAVVMPGVTIGKSSVIGAGVVVAEDVPENTLLTGATKLSIAKWR